MKLYIAMNAVWKIVLEQFPLKQSVEIPRVNSKVTFQTIQFGNCNRNYHHHHHHHSPLHEAMAVATAYIWRLIIFVWFFFSKLFLCIEIEIITVFYFHFQFHFCFLSFGDSIFVSLIFAVVEICVHFICKRVKLRNSFGIFSSICGFFFLSISVVARAICNVRVFVCALLSQMRAWSTARKTFSIVKIATMLANTTTMPAQKWEWRRRKKSIEKECINLFPNIQTRTQ